MRAKQLGLGALLLSGAIGCFEAVSELSETEQVAEALTRGLRFDGGEIRDGNLPGSDADEVSLLPPDLPTLMSPGEVSLMAFDSDNPDEASNPAAATLMQFEGSHRHISVDGNGSDGNSGIDLGGVPTGTDGEPAVRKGQHFEHRFTVDDGICDSLCNKQHPVRMALALKLRDGRVSRAHFVDFTLDCTARGKASACASERTGHGSSSNLPFARACQNAATVCSDFAGMVGVSSTDLALCANLYECGRAFFADDPYCAGRVDDMVQCMADADSVSACDACSVISDDLGSNCPYPSSCFGTDVGLPDAGTGDPPARVDAGMSGGGSGTDGVPFVLTDSLLQNCQMMCDFSQAQGCSVAASCVQDCTGGLAGTVCEPALVALQRCAVKTGDPSATCFDTAPVPATDLCPGETQQVTDCLVANPGLFDAGTP